MTFEGGREILSLPTANRAGQSSWRAFLYGHLAGWQLQIRTVRPEPARLRLDLLGSFRAHVAFGKGVDR
jgi:hypothetical protein